MIVGNIYPDGYNFGLESRKDPLNHRIEITAWAVYPGDIVRSITIAEPIHGPKPKSIQASPELIEDISAANEELNWAGYLNEIEVADTMTVDSAGALSLHID